jgi:hypothetical protein
MHIENKLRERAATGLTCLRLAEEARWLWDWAQENHRDEAGCPSTPLVVENQIRSEFKCVRASPTK